MKERIPRSAAPSPETRDVLRQFLASALDLTLAAPDRPPDEPMLVWHRELAASLGVVPRHPRTHRELLDGALRLQRILRGLPDPLMASPPPAPARPRSRVPSA